MVNRVVGFAAFIVFVSMLTGPSRAQEAIFRTSAERVVVAVVARNAEGRPVKGLAPADFEVLDDGRSRNILDFRNDAGPISAAFLIDTSGSMHVGGKLARAGEMIHFLLASMDEATDEAALYVFDKAVRNPQPFTNDFQKIKASLGGVKPWGSTSLYDAIANTAQQLAERPGRRAVIVLTDGIDTSSQMTPQQVSGIASSIDMPVYIVAIETPATEAGDLSNLARWSGGMLYGAATAVESSVVARQIVGELRHQYLLAFEPSQVAGWHRIEVRSRKRMALQSRSGYWVRDSVFAR